ncbi:MAG: Fe-dependent oxidoreductase alcohol dehydrogenase [Elusimicrobia bacterium]|nr:MAG: Fe-dependent oxidoreductase alcohol dehydrogenase [Elusimicrobiota bacterium]KAF0154943.1 MAG: Fe-dependent oxidoreductase alcohol dehydrogenase [Elusimicrobiota bacterium]
MQNFVFANPTKIIFGRDSIPKLGPEAAKAGKKALFVYGGGSIKRNGVYEAVTSALGKNGVEITEHPGVKPNPVLSHVREGMKKAAEAGCDLIVAAGGGSVIDESKAIAAGLKYGGDAWDLFCGKAQVKDALPVFAALTLPATGSEMNSGCVVTNEETRQKFSARGPALFPRVSALDPETTMTLPREQTAYGAVDALAHIIEGYFTARDPDAEVTDEIVHGLARSIVASTRRILKDPADYNARASMMWSATLALNGLPTCGYGGMTFINHAIEHSLSALYDIAHGAGLAIVLPAWFRHHLETEGPRRLDKFGRAVFGTTKAEACVNAFEDFFREAGAPLRLSEVKIPASDVPRIAENAMMLIRMWGLRHEQPEIEKILRLAA